MTDPAKTDRDQLRAQLAETVAELRPIEEEAAEIERRARPVRDRRDALVVALADAGESYASIAADVGLNKSRVQQIIARARRG